MTPPFLKEVLIILLRGGPSFFQIPLPPTPQIWGLPSLTLRPHDPPSTHRQGSPLYHRKRFWVLETSLSFSLDLPQLPAGLNPRRPHSVAGHGGSLHKMAPLTNAERPVKRTQPGNQGNGEQTGA